MLRLTFGGMTGGLLLTCSIALAQVAAPTRVSFSEPPAAEPGEFKPAPPETTVIPGQPASLPPQVIQTAAPQQPLAAQQPAPPSTPTAPTVANPGPRPATGVQPAQYTTPATRPAAPAVLYPEPPTPTVKISIKGVDTAATGQDLTYRLTVTNPSEARAHNVIVHCPMPRGARYVKSLPEAKVLDEKELEWNLQTLEPGASRTIDVDFKPAPDTMEISVVGKVQFEHGRVVKTKLSNPMLEMKKTSPAQGILHEPMTFKIIVTNPGKVPVTDLQIVDTLPEGLEYVQETATGTGAIPVSKAGPKPNQRTWTLGIMKPKETRTIEYRVMPCKLGDWTSDAVATALGVHEKAGCNTAVHEARISLQVTGPTNNKGTANQSTPLLVHVHNQGTAVLHNVRVICTFPTDIRLAKVASGGHLFKDAVQWMIPTLEPNETKDLSLSLTAPSAGLRELVVSARADKGLEQRQKVQVVFEGTAALNWQTEGTPTAAPGQEIVYTVTIKNPGSAVAKNIGVVVDLPEQVEFRQAQPDFRRGQGAVYFNAVNVPANQSVTFKIVTVARKAGEARFQFELNAEGMSAGPLRHTKITTISPSGDPKDVDPTRIGGADPMEPKKPETKKVIPVTGNAPADPVAREPKPPVTGTPVVAPPMAPEPKKSEPMMPPPLDLIIPESTPPAAPPEPKKQ